MLNLAENLIGLKKTFRHFPLVFTSWALESSFYSMYSILCSNGACVSPDGRIADSMRTVRRVVCREPAWIQMALWAQTISCTGDVPFLLDPHCLWKHEACRFPNSSVRNPQDFLLPWGMLRLQSRTASAVWVTQPQMPREMKYGMLSQCVAWGIVECHAV